MGVKLKTNKVPYYHKPPEASVPLDIDATRLYWRVEHYFSKVFP